MEWEMDLGWVNLSNGSIFDEILFIICHCCCNMPHVVVSNRLHLPQCCWCSWFMASYMQIVSYPPFLLSKAWPLDHYAVLPSRLLQSYSSSTIGSVPFCFIIFVNFWAQRVFNFATPPLSHQRLHFLPRPHILDFCRATSIRKSTCQLKVLVTQGYS
jgi:hypothetical protein